MDQKKNGQFIKELRISKGLTQEQLAELFGVSNRSVSRWETGANMPDLALLIEIAKYFDVSIDEILDGERKTEVMDKKMEETIYKVADYSNQEKQQLQRRMVWLFIAGLASFTVYFIMEFSGFTGTPFKDALMGFVLGFSYGIMIVGLLYVTGNLEKFKAFKKKLLKRGQ